MKSVFKDPDVVVRREQRVQKKNGWNEGAFSILLTWTDRCRQLCEIFFRRGGGSHLFRPEVAKKQ